VRGIELWKTFEDNADHDVIVKRPDPSSLVWTKIPMEIKFNVVSSAAMMEVVKSALANQAKHAIRLIEL
jgi:hypothetical protein